MLHEMKVVTFWDAGATFALTRTLTSFFCKSETCGHLFSFQIADRLYLLPAIRHPWFSVYQSEILSESRRYPENIEAAIADRLCSYGQMLCTLQTYSDQHCCRSLQYKWCSRLLIAACRVIIILKSILSQKIRLFRNGSSGCSWLPTTFGAGSRNGIHRNPEMPNPIIH